MNRNLVKRFAKKSALGLQDAADVNDIMRDVDSLRVFTVRQRDFFQFTSAVLGPSRAWTEETPWKVEKSTVRGLKVAVLGLNSAWTAEGGDEDQGRLILGEHQVNKALDEADSFSPDLKIALVHHPLDWLRGFDQERVKARLLGAGGVHFLLRGHLHMGRIPRQANPDAQCIELAAGACWQDSTYSHGVTVVRLDVDAGIGDVHLWRYSAEGRGFWKRDNFLYENLHEGKWSFSLPQRWGFRRAVVNSTEGLPPSQPRQLETRPSALQVAGLNLQVLWDRSSYRAGAELCKALITIHLDQQSVAQTQEDEQERQEIRTPVHHLLVLDISGSMNEPDKYPVLVEAVDFYMRTVADDDLVTLIPFSTASDVLVGALPVGHVRAQHPSVDALLSAWPHRFQGTHMATALMHAFKHIKDARQRGFTGVERLNCLTDGILGDYLPCHLAAQRIHELGVSVSVFGFGADFDAATADALVAEVEGTVRYVPTGGNELKEYFGHMARTSRRIALRRAELSIEVSPNVTCFDVFVCRPHERHVGNFADQQSPLVKRHLGELEHSKTYIFLAELRPWQAVPEIGKIHFHATAVSGPVHKVLPLRPVFGAHSAPQDPVVQMMATSLGTLIKKDRDTQIAALEARVELYKREGRAPQHIASLENQLKVLQRGGSVQDLSADDRNFAEADAASQSTRGF